MSGTIVSGVVNLEKALGKLVKQVSGRQLVTALVKGGEVVEREAKLNVEEQELIDSGDLRADIQTKPVFAEEAVTVGTNKEYAAIHEFGGTVKPRVTPRMRSWAWAMYAETGEEVYKGIALTTKTHLEITIPARPYLRPAVDDHQDQIIQAVANAIKQMLLKAVA